MKRLLLIFTGLWILLSASMVNADTQPYKIGILMWHESQHDEKTLQGFITGIKLSGIPHKIELKRAYEDEARPEFFSGTGR